MAMPKHKQSESHAYDFREQMAGERKKRDGGKKKMHMTIEQADNGGHMVRHHSISDGGDMPGMGMKPEEHAFGKHEGGKMLAHVGKVLGIPNSGEEAGESAHNFSSDQQAENAGEKMGEMDEGQDA